MLETGESVPDLSVIIPAVNGPDILLDCLASLRRNAQSGPILEVIVIDRCGEPVRQALAAKAPEAIVISVPPQTSIPLMRARGFEMARGEVVAVIEDHVLVPPDWARQILRALSTGADVVGEVSTTQPRRQRWTGPPSCASTATCLRQRRAMTSADSLARTWPIGAS